MAATTMVHVRVDENIKTLPFALKVQNATSRVAIAEASETIKSRSARFTTSL